MSIPATETEPHALLTKQEAASELRVCTRTIENLMKARALTYLKVGSAVRIPVETIQEYLAANTVAAESPASDDAESDEEDDWDEYP